MMPTGEIEAALIGALLSDPAAYLAVAVEHGVRREWFSDDVWGVTWAAFAEIWKRGEAETAEAALVLAEARRIAAADKDPSLKDRLDAGRYSDVIEHSGFAVASYCSELKDAFLKKNIRALLNREMKQADVSSAEAVGIAIRTGLDGILESASSAREIPAAEVFRRITDEYREAYQKRIVEKRLDWTPGLRMPWTELTRIMNGVRPGLHVLAARPSVGKTSFAVNLMRYWCDQGARVVFCSLDMPRKEVLRRFLAERSRVSVSKAIYSPTQHDLAAIDAVEKVQVALPLTVVEMRDVDDFATFCKVRKAAGKVDVAVIDYLQLMHARALGREDAVEYARISYVSNALKDLANRLELPVVALCQLNRESTKADRAGQMPGLADLRGSGSIEQDAFTVAILHRDERTVTRWSSAEFTPTKLMPDGARSAVKVLDPVWWVLCKSQNGGTGQYPFVVWKPYFAWMLGDYDAESITATVGSGAAAKTESFHYPKFERVHADWRHDPLENSLRMSGELIDENAQNDGPGVVAEVPQGVDDYPDDEEEDA